jgi:ribosome-binding protein aMBF1 (putative translation factor)
MNPLGRGDLKDVDLSYAPTRFRSNPILADRESWWEHHRLSDVAVRFGKRLREIREGTGISQEKLAELAGLHRTYVSSVERGLRNISIENIERLAVALAVSMRDLMPETEPRKKKS